MRPDWFAPKRRGYGAGLPIAGQGRAVLAAFFVGIALCQLLPRVTRLLVTSAFVAGVVAIAGCTTRGGRHWRG